MTQLLAAPPRASAPSRPTRALTAQKRNTRIGHLLLLPSIAILVVVIVFPVLNSIWMSFTDRSLLDVTSGNFVGLENYFSLFTSDDFRQSVGNTVVWTIVNVVAQVALGVGLAVLLNTKLRARFLLRAFAIVPWILPSVSAVLIWRNLYDPAIGLFNSIGMNLGLLEKPVVWLGSTDTAMGAVLVESVWKGTPFVMLIVLAGLQSMPKELYEAAAVDGANAWTTFWRIVLPSIKSTVALATILTTTYTVNNFNAVWLMTEGGPLGSTEIVFTYGYKQGFVKYEFGKAAAVSVTLFIVLLAIAIVYLFLLERKGQKSNV